MVEDLNSAQDFLKHKHVSFLTSGPLLIPQIHRMPRGSSMIPNSVAFHSQHEQGLPGTPGGTSGRKQGDASPE